jgi:glycosyltransferase involved in cell wall biosynthesis
MKISVAIPAYNEEAYIARTLDSLAQQDFIGNLEIIVCLNACTDRTQAIVESWSQYKKISVKIINEPHKGVSRARQTACATASGEIVISADADSIYPRDWAFTIAKAFKQDENLVALYGPVRLRDFQGRAGFFLRIFQFVFNDLFTFFGRIVGWHNVIGSNLAIRRATFEKIGGFNTELGTMEDNEITRRLRRVGRVRFSSKMVAYASARRYNQFGFWHTVYFYFRNGIKGIFFKQQTEDLQDLNKR